MHRVKGLQFDAVFLAGINEGIIPLEALLNNVADGTAREHLLNLERSLIHVAATRAKRSLSVSYFGNPSPLIVSSP
jgi:superfamily I DNA/RNA helicase